jgi:hypothetical protein
MWFSKPVELTTKKANKIDNILKIAAKKSVTVTARRAIARRGSLNTKT